MHSNKLSHLTPISNLVWMLTCEFKEMFGVALTCDSHCLETIYIYMHIGSFDPQNNPKEVGTTVTPTLQIRKWKHREGK